MTIFQKNNTTAYAKKQSAKGSAATIDNASAIDPTQDSGFVQPKGENIDRGLLRGSRWPSKQAVGGRWGEGPYTLELRGSGTAGTEPEFGPLLETLLGTVVTNAAGTVNDAAATTTEFDSDLDLTVGQLVRVDIAGSYEVRRISAKSGAGPTYTYTVQRAFSQAPADTAVIAAGVSYIHLGTESEAYFTLDQFLDGLRLLCVDCVAESLQVGVNERDVIRGVFGLRSLSCEESAATDGNSPTYDDTSPLLGTECNLLQDGTATNMKSMELDLTTRRARGGINTTGYGELPWMSRFEASVKLTPWVEDGQPFTDFFAETQIDVEMTKGATAGNILHILAEDLQRTDPSIGDDEGDFSWDDSLMVTGGVYVGFF